MAILPYVVSTTPVQLHGVLTYHLFTLKPEDINFSNGESRIVYTEWYTTAKERGKVAL